MLTMGIPLLGDLPQECVTDLLVAAANVARMEKEIFFICPQGIVPHDRAREVIMREALRQKSDLLWFIDSDTRPPNDAFPKLKKVLVERRAVMVSGYYVQKGYPFSTTWGTSKPEGEAEGLVEIKDKENSVRIDTCGLGCALIDLNWIRDNLIPPYFLMTPDPTLPTMYKWEDAFFCKQIREKGGRIYGLASVVCVHMGRRGEMRPDNAGKIRKSFEKGMKK